MDDYPEWGQQDDNFCRWCKPWHWEHNYQTIHLSARDNGLWLSWCDPIVLGEERIGYIADLWVGPVGQLTIIAASVSEDPRHLRKCPCGSPEFSCRLLWATDTDITLRIPSAHPDGDRTVRIWSGRGRKGEPARPDPAPDESPDGAFLRGLRR